MIQAELLSFSAKSPFSHLSPMLPLAQAKSLGVVLDPSLPLTNFTSGPLGEQASSAFTVSRF